MKALYLLPGMALLAFANIATATEISDFINKRNCDQVLDKGYYQICYDYRAKGARYVGYLLDGKKVAEGNIKKRPRFYPDQEIPAQFRTTSSDYTRNEFHADRGHLAPDASFDWSQKSLKSVYSMANIIPQYNKINQRTWSKAERHERMVAAKLGKVMVINGVEYGDYSHRLQKSGIAYPVAFWKMLHSHDGFERCLYYRNDHKIDVKNDELRNHEIDCKLLAKAM